MSIDILLLDDIIEFFFRCFDTFQYNFNIRKTMGVDAETHLIALKACELNVQWIIIYIKCFIWDNPA